ncbi:MAG TPA: hypothetical protein VK206_06310 [Anaerolineales bacterium]|nr:hypothetical protein [Anaerolineales bacterium]
MAEWSELLDKQLADYVSRREDWQKAASEKIFPYISTRLPAMEVAHRNIILLYPFLCNQAYQKIGLEINATCVLYVGIGCGAGWVTTYQDRPAILFGLENIAECGWSDSNSISGLIAHELGHVIHNTFRKQVSLGDGDGAWWQLFSEGFAQRCEHLILGQNTWHEGAGSNQNWIAWCQAKKAYLASEFLRFVAEGKDMRPFFGSWYHIDGYSQCGYFLGHEAVKELELSGMSIREIGMLEKPENQLRETLEYFAKNERT